MRMDADRDADVLVMSGERHGVLARRDVLPRSEDAFDAGLSRAFEHLRDVGRKASIGQMRVRVDHGGGGKFSNGRGHLCRGGGAGHERSAPPPGPPRVWRAPPPPRPPSPAPKKRTAPRDGPRRTR